MYKEGIVLNDITVDVLLEFLYTKFAVTFILCLIGSWIREALKAYPSKKEESIKTQIVNIGRMATSTIFSTFLMCACADYVELQFSIYAIICVLCGMWGLAIVNVVMSGKFLSNSDILKKITDPIIQGAIKTVSKELEEQQKELEKQQEEADDKKEVESSDNNKEINNKEEEK